MDPLLSGLLIIAAMLVVAMAGVPIGLSMSAVAFAGLWIIGGLDAALGTFRTLPYAVSSQYTFAVVPMFVLMGAFAAQAGITGELYTAAYRFFSRMRGNLFYATILASAGFAAVSGSTVVSSAVFTRMALPEMIRFRFKRGVGGGCIAAAGTFAALIPPSISMVIYGMITNESIGALLMAGIIPGILTAVVYLIGIRILLIFYPDWAPPATERFTWAQKLDSLRGIWALVLLVGLVMGGIYTGIMPPSAAGAVGAAGALAICTMRGRLKGQDFWESLKQSASITAVLFLIIVGGLLFSRLLLYTGFVTSITGLVEDTQLTAPVFLIALVLMYLLLGMFIDTVSMMVMTIPFVYPIVLAMGFDPIWFGVIMIKLVEIAAITPPVGLNLYAVLSASRGELKTNELFVGITPFLCFEFVTLGILLAFPQVALWLPQTMFQ